MLKQSDFNRCDKQITFYHKKCLIMLLFLMKLVKFVLYHTCTLKC